MPGKEKWCFWKAVKKNNPNILNTGGGDMRKFDLLIVVFCLWSGWGYAGEAALVSAPADQNVIDKIFSPHSVDENGKFKIKVGLELRYRLELRDDLSLRNRTYEDDVLNLLRNRINLDAAYQPEKEGGKIRAFVEAQDSRSFASSALNRNAAFVDEFDLRQLFVEFAGDPQTFPVQLKVGRQELSYGEERLVGAFNWSNVARVFNAAKLIYTPTAWLQLDAFMSRVVQVRKERPNEDSSNDNFFGAVAALKPFQNHVIDTNFFVRNLRNDSLTGERLGIRGPMTEYTLGNRFRGKKWNFDYGTEYAVQFGSRAHDNIRAWMFHQDVAYTFVKLPWAPKLLAEYNHASGDRNPTDGVVETFDQLYPTNHDKYGYIDLVGLRNINNIRLGTSAKPCSRVTLSADFHWFFRDARESAWFSASGAVMRAANVRAGRQIGEELDLTATIKINKYLNALIGYSHFFAGPFATDTSGNDGADFFYMQVTFKA